MAYVEEELIEEAVKKAVHVLGPMGNFEYPIDNDVVPNITVVSKKHGQIWYGDIKYSVWLNKLDTLQNSLGCTCILM